MRPKTALSLNTAAKNEMADIDSGLRSIAPLTVAGRGCEQLA